MNGIARPEWACIGESPNAAFYSIRPGLLAVVPSQDCRDDRASARASLAMQRARSLEEGRRLAVVVFMDPVLSQDSDARTVYSEEVEPRYVSCYALVGESFFGHAMTAVYTGLTRPPVPTQAFRSFADAEPWLQEMSLEHGGPL